MNELPKGEPAHNAGPGDPAEVMDSPRAGKI